MPPKTIARVVMACVRRYPPHLPRGSRWKTIRHASPGHPLEARRPVLMHLASSLRRAGESILSHSCNRAKFTRKTHPGTPLPQQEQDSGHNGYAKAVHSRSPATMKTQVDNRKILGWHTFVYESEQIASATSHRLEVGLISFGHMTL